MDWGDIKPLLAKAAPIVGTLVGGPAGTAVGGLVAAALGVDDKPEAVYEKLKADPDAIVKVKEMELRHSERLEELQIEEAKLSIERERVAAQDRASARQMAVQTTLKPQITIATLLHIAFAIALYFIFVQAFEFSDVQERILMFLLGILSAGLTQTWNFFLGSSLGSKQKSDAISNLTRR